MGRSEEERLDRAARATGRNLWQRACETEAPDDEAERLLDLAAYADGLLETDEAERVAAVVEAEPAAASDVAAARSLADGSDAGAASTRIVERALQLVPPQIERGRVIAFPQHRWARRLAYGAAQWGGLAAAIVLAGWLGFSMGSGTSLVLSQRAQVSDDAVLPDLLDPGTGFMHELTQDPQT